MKAKWLVLAVGLSGLLLLVTFCGSCGGSGECTHSVVPKEPDPAMCTSTIEGVVYFEGKVPENPEIQMSEPACRSGHGGATVRADRVLVHDGKLQNVLVWVEKGLETYAFAVPTTDVTVDNRGCLYVPRVQGVQAHQPIRLLNSDPLAHNVHGYATANRSFNVSLAYKGNEIRRWCCEPEVPVTLRCDIHGWMVGYLGIIPNPYFGVTDRDGVFRFPRKLPPGTYTLRAWHEVYGVQRVPVTVAEGQTGTISIRYLDK